MTIPEQVVDDSTLYLDRAAVRSIITGVADEHVHVTEGLLADIDRLSILTAADIAGRAQGLPAEWIEFYQKHHPSVAELQELVALFSNRSLVGVQRPEDVARWRDAEHALSAAYLRLRGMIPGAFDTPHAPTPEQVWETTEKALERALPHTGQPVDAPMSFPHDRRLAEPDMTDVQIQEWISACNHEPARRVLRAYLSLRDELRRPHTGQPQEGALSEDAVLDALRKCWGNQDVRDAMTVTKWKDGIDIQAPSHSLMMFVSLVRRLSPAPASPRRAEGEGHERTTPVIPPIGQEKSR